MLINAVVLWQRTETFAVSLPGLSGLWSLPAVVSFSLPLSVLSGGKPRPPPTSDMVVPDGPVNSAATVDRPDMK